MQSIGDSRGWRQARPDAGRCVEPTTQATSLRRLRWAPLYAPATQAVQRDLLYLGVLLAAAALLRTPAARRAAEPALAAGTVVVIGYALSERLLPGVIQFAHSGAALGRLEQPLTYWN